MINRALLLIALVFTCVGNAHANIITYEAYLSGSAENPPNASPGSGVVIADYDSDLHSLALEVSFSDLLGTVTGAHIHCCIDAPGNVGVATPVPTFPGFPAGVTAGIYSNTFDLTDPTSFNATFITNNGGTLASAEAALAAGLAAGRAYFNIHTTFLHRGRDTRIPVLRS